MSEKGKLYTLFIWNEGCIDVEALGTEQELLGYWVNNKEQLSNWLIESSGVSDDVRDLHNLIVNSHANSVDDIYVICDEFENHRWQLVIQLIDNLCPSIPDGEYIWVEFVNHDFPQPYAYTVRSQKRFDNFEHALRASVKNWKLRRPNSYKYGDGVVFWIAPAKQNGLMQHTEASLLDFHLGRACDSWFKFNDRFRSVQKKQEMER